MKLWIGSFDCRLLVANRIEAADQRRDSLFLQLQPAHGELHPGGRGAHVFDGGAETSHFDEQRAKHVGTLA